jgi:hypothetical protein
VVQEGDFMDSIFKRAGRNSIFANCLAIAYRILSSEMILDASSQFPFIGGSTESGDVDQESVSQVSDPPLPGLICLILLKEV